MICVVIVDSETGLYNSRSFGVGALKVSQYYDPSLSLWLGVDPLADQFPGWSPYNYTMNNPSNMIDPDGRAPCPPGEDCDTYSGGTLPEISVTASRTGVHDQTPERYGYNGTLEQWQSQYGCEGCSYGNTQGFWTAGDNGSFDNYVARQDKAESDRIAVPRVGHITRGPNGRLSTSLKGITGARQLLARDIMQLRSVYPDIPNEVLQTVIQMNKSMYPSAFKK